jgi:hypothetical protein
VIAAVADAQPGDIYADAQKRLFRVEFVVQEPVVGMRMVEEPSVKLYAGLSDAQWTGFTRVLR